MLNLTVIIHSPSFLSLSIVVCLSLCLSPCICHCICLPYLYYFFHDIFPKLPQEPALVWASTEDFTKTRNYLGKIILQLWGITEFIPRFEAKFVTNLGESLILGRNLSLVNIYELHKYMIYIAYYTVLNLQLRAKMTNLSQK